MIEVRSFTSAQDGIADKLLTPVTVKGGAMGMEVKAQWDTGATCTCIAEAVVDALGLEAVRLGAISSPTGIRKKCCQRHFFGLLLPRILQLFRVSVGQAERL